MVGSFVLLRYVLFPIVPVDHLYSSIPEGADYVILVDTEELLSLSISEFLTSPSQGNPFDDDDEEDDDSDEKYDLKDILLKGIWHGLEIPEQVICWVTEFGDGPKQALLPLSNSSEFESMLSSFPDSSDWYMNKDSLWTNGVQYLSVEHDHLIICLSRPEVNRDIHYTAKDWSLEIGQGMEIENVLVRYYVARRSQPSGHGTIRSQDGNIRLSYTSIESLGFEGRVVNASPFSMALQVDADKLCSAFKDKSGNHFLQRPMNNWGLNKLIKDSIWDGRFELHVEGISSEQQEFITYAYNDDFEKIERKEMKNVLNANLWAEIGLARSTDSLFYKKGWVKEVDGTDLFVKYPIQEVKFKETSEEAILNSGKMDSTYGKTGQQSNLFLSVDVISLEREWNQFAPDSLAFVSGIEYVEGRVIDAGHELIFEFSFTDTNRQGLFSIVDTPIFSHLP